MEKIIYIDLSNGNVKEEKYNFEKVGEYGRGLASYLARKEIPTGVARYDIENCLVLAPGLFSGTLTPCTGRLTIAAKEDKESGIQFVNIGGPLSQKLGSLNIAAVVISGENKKEAPAVISINEEKIEVLHESAVKEKTISETINLLRQKLGAESAIIGIGSAGEHMLSLSAVFSTYPLGEPAFTCARGGMGDIFGAKGLKAVVVNSKGHFDGKVVHKEQFNRLSKEVSQSIVDHPICGGALPALGSMTLMKMMKNSRDFKFELEEKAEKKAAAFNSEAQKINRNCAPLCVIGCLNRHVREGEKFFRSPAESEVLAALEECFGIEDSDFASMLNYKGFEMGIDTVEFVFSCALFYKLQDIKVTKEVLEGALADIDKQTIAGRVIGSRTTGIYRLYKDKKELDGMVTKASIDERSRFEVKLPYKMEGFESLDDKDYLYGWMTALSNLGICLFSSFAIIEDEKSLDRLSELFYLRTGVRITKDELITRALDNLREEEEYEAAAKTGNVKKRVPEFVKVLHRYFGREKA